MYSLTATNHLFRDTDLIKGKTAENRIFPGGGEPKTKGFTQMPKTRPGKED